jgi:hypothetical protein
MLAPWEYDLSIRPVRPMGDTAGQWQTKDARFMILRLDDLDTGKMHRRWSLRSSYTTEDAFLRANGLYGASFTTRQEALAALAQALGAPFPPT